MSEPLKIKANGVECQFEPAVDKNLLETLEKAGLEPHYHCRDGFCGACHCKLVSGETEYQLDPLAFVRDGEVLLCCAVAKTDLVLEYD
jgi:ferredoxin